jgi:outer membrane protein assembly factor BamB
MLVRSVDGDERWLCPHEPLTQTLRTTIMKSLSQSFLCRCGIFAIFTSAGMATDWPTHMGNNQRTGVTAEQLPDATLVQKWAFTSPTPPQTAWFRQMRYDGSNAANGEKSQRAYDSAFNLCVVGSDLFYASSSEYAVVCLDTASGTEKWRFIAEGPVRIAPSYANGKLYFGSDDGRACCIDATTGLEVWRYSPTNNTDALLPHNLDFVSLTPCRTGVLVQNGRAYAGFGMLPWESAYLVALNADTGAEIYKKTFNAASKAATSTGNADFSTTDNSLTFEGSMLALADNTKLFVPQGRMSPISFDMTTGTAQGRLAGAGGSWTLITPDNGRVVVGPSYGNQYDSRRVRLHEDDPASRTIVASYERASALLVSGAQSYVIVEGKVQAKNRSTAATVWTKDGEHPNTMITGGTTLYVGGRNKVLCLDTATGSLLKTLPATGDVFTLALANGRLFASTTRGVIHCYAP